ncbi:ParB/RepB/Spo0J family partition protein [Brevundimonas sp. NIBR10]|uniref:ParB/RepB/Spo0J family partition protein n=1 Tax=Brevundimonas sp. NIBR10 TaxID=3015997 RepID=UPI0022F1D29C|nr:ParB/RepB/Spo0J family partition protein [Brevundimonas sp. NIBR10]
MSERQRGLGRGLSALMGETINEPVSVTGDASRGVTTLPIEQIKPNPHQPRKIFAQEQLDELANSIRDKGVLQPILVRPITGQSDLYQIVAGERRWRASQAARLTEVPVVIREMDDAEVFEVAIIENVQRADLNPIEEAEAYKQLMEQFARTQDMVAGIVGKSRSHVANTIRLLQLPDGVIDYVRDGRLSAGHARALVTAPDPATLAEQVHRDGLNVRQTEALARKAAAGPVAPVTKAGGGSREGAADIAALENDLADALGLKVSLADRGGKGDLVLSYATLEQLDDLCRRLMRL